MVTCNVLAYFFFCYIYIRSKPPKVADFKAMLIRAIKVMNIWIILCVVVLSQSDGLVNIYGEELKFRISFSSLMSVLTHSGTVTWVNQYYGVELKFISFFFFAVSVFIYLITILLVLHVYHLFIYTYPFTKKQKQKKFWQSSSKMYSVLSVTPLCPPPTHT